MNNLKKEATYNVYRRCGICTGIVSRIVITDNFNQLAQGVVLDRTATKCLMALDLRKIVFEKNSVAGKDILNKSIFNSYVYPLCDLNKREYIVPENNELVIRDIHEYNDLLFYLGINKEISTRSDLKDIKNILLTNNNELLLPSNKMVLSKDGIINPNKVESINTQAKNLYEFSRLDLPTKPQKLEKVMIKYLGIYN